ncbi:MAG: tRNA preQ1(34) S-adenosylmethionine ribosyltransferase-isomerase QueA [Acidimicrobiia bacterium]
MADLDYPLPAEAIAQHPIEPRDAARLLVDRGPGQPPEHRHVRDLASLLRPGDLVVINDTRVVPARLHLRRASGGAVEVLLLERTGHDRWEALVRPSRKIKPGEQLSHDELIVEIGEVLDSDGTRAVRICADDPMAALAVHGSMPLPPYITAALDDPDRYQTVYARVPGAAAAPTAGLHFTDALLDRVREATAGIERVELIVGLDTFRPVAVDDPDDHVMHSEAFVVSDAVLARCREVKRSGGRVVAVGTTTVRALESAAAGKSHRTDLFIRPGFDFQIVDVMMTNFHMPRTTLLLMVEAFIGERWRELYATSLSEGYRFLSFGDAMLLERLTPAAGTPRADLQTKSGT